MKKHAIASTLVLLLAAAVGTQAEDMIFFQSSSRDMDAWVEADARARLSLGRLLVSERNKSGDTGNILLSENLPYFKEGVVELDVKQVIAGTYSLQMLLFKQGQHVGAVDLATGEKREGPTSFWLKAYEVPPGTDELLFKLWVGGMEGASTKFNDLTYTVSLNEELYVLDEHFEAPGTWEQDNVLISFDRDGAEVRLKPGVAYGSFLHSKRLDRAGFDKLLIDVPEVENGNMTIQFIMFDQEDTYITSVDVMKAFTKGKHILRSGDIEWAPGTEHFMIKLWLGGQPSARAELTRMMAFKSEPQPETLTEN